MSIIRRPYFDKNKIPSSWSISRKRWLREGAILKIVGGIVLLLISIFLFLITAPKQSYKANLLRIQPGQSVASIAQELEDRSIIRSATLLRVFFSVTRTAHTIKSGDYVFEPRSNMLTILNALSDGDYGEAYTWVTIPEGSTNREVASIITKKIPTMSKNTFVELAKDKEGYLFPDTYHFSRLATEQEVIEIMHSTFLEKTRLLRLQMLEQDFKNIIIIASMLEHEANSIEDGRVISGVIQNRLRQDMRLQIDATLKYLTGRGSAQLTRSDLAMKSPYNTYRNKGLPPGPIGNPGFEMITAAMYPQATKYIYYLHAPDGTAYYAVTHDEHVRNKQKYLR